MTVGIKWAINYANIIRGCWLASTKILKLCLVVGLIQVIKGKQGSCNRAGQFYHSTMMRK